MKNYIFAGLLAIIALLALIACEPREVTAPVPEVAMPEPLKPEPKAKWEIEWEKTLAEARKEGKVQVHAFSGIGAAVRQEVVERVNSRYGISVEITVGRGLELAERLLRERRAGLYMADLYWNGPTAIFTRIKPEGVLQPLEPLLLLPEVTDPNLWFERRLPFMDEDKFVLAFLASASEPIRINTSLVKKEDFLSYRDLLQPKWKGKIAMGDPSSGGSGGMWFSSIGVRVLGMDYLRELAKQDIVFSRDIRLLNEWVARGKYPIGLGVGGTGIYIEMKRAGAPISEHVPREGAYFSSTGSGVIAVYKDNPHPNATKVFINWLLSREGVTIVSKGVETESARTDVPTDFLDPASLRKPGIHYFNTNTEEHQVKQTEYQLLAKEIFNIR